jgi:luciferase family oxidoreductase group 1
MVPLSVLDLAPIKSNGDAAQSFRESVDLAQHAERLGYRRFWLAEHHGMPGIASAATSVLIGHVASATASIRVGAGGIMSPNHSPLVIAEQFGTLDALYPGRIDLGLGRAPGSDHATARALRRNSSSDPEAFPQDVLELMSYFEGTSAVRAVPGVGANVEMWILGSSLFGAQLAAALGLPYAFASHFAPAALLQAIDVYRSRFKPSARCQKPYVMLGFNVIAANTDDEARLLLTSMQQSFINLRRGRPTTLQPPAENFQDQLAPHERLMLDEVLSASAVGSPNTVREQLTDFIARTDADEIMVASMIYDHAARVHSYEITADLLRAG